MDQAIRVGKIYSLISKIMNDVGFISKDRKNPQQGYSFRGIDDVLNALQAPLIKHGVFFTPCVLTKEREERPSKSGGTLIYTILTVKYSFFADDGSSFDIVTIGEAYDSGDKSANKAMSASLKYALLQLFCIPTEEEKDTEYHSPEPKAKATLSQSQPARLQSSAFAQPAPSGAPSEAQIKRLFAIARSCMWADAHVRSFMKQAYGADSTKQLTVAEYEEFCKIMETMSFTEASQSKIAGNHNVDPESFQNFGVVK